MNMHIAIIGGGINGYCCGVRILEHYKSTGQKVVVSVISDDFTPNTTGDGSAGLWSPYLIGNTTKERVHKWAADMHDFLEALFKTEDAGIAGICLITVYRVSTHETVDDFWKDIVYGCQPLSQKMLNELNAHRSEDRKFKSGLEFITFTSELKKLLPYLMHRFEQLGGLQVLQKVTNLKDFTVNTHYDVVINCTGLGSRLMIPDKQVFPVRGQVQRVRARHIFHAVLDDSDDGNYIIPNCDTVVLGGTHQEDEYNMQVSLSDRRFIVEGCQKIVPALKNAAVISDWVGLRPGRNAVRLEVDHQMADEIVAATKARAGEFTRNPTFKQRLNKPIIIHNYGHGGSGITLSWGCANNVLELLEAEIAKLREHDDYKAKL